MAEKFDEFSKHLASKHSRRGAFKLFGAGIIGAAAATAFGHTASATPSFNGHFNQTQPNFNAILDRLAPYFNENAQLRDALQEISEKIEEIEKKRGFKIWLPWVK